MAKQTALYLTDTIKTVAATLTSADTTAWKTIYTAGTDDALLKGFMAVSDDTASINLRIGLDIGGTVYQIGTINIPIAAGTNGSVHGVDLLNSLSFAGALTDANGKRYLPLLGGVIVKVACLATMTAAKTLTVTAFAEEY